MKKDRYYTIVSHYESCLKKYGDNHKGVDWPKLEDVDKRYQVMLDLIKFRGCENDKISLLDFGCGTAHLLEYIRKKGYDNINYSGLDISENFIKVAKTKFPEIDFMKKDLLQSPESGGTYDFIILNGVFTEKRDLTFEEMWEYFTNLLKIIFSKAKVGVAFNVMSKIVDWERDDLFHVSMDLISIYLCKYLSRNFIIRNDYGLYEYTVYVYK